MLTFWSHVSGFVFGYVMFSGILLFMSGWPLVTVVLVSLGIVIAGVVMRKVQV